MLDYSYMGLVKKLVSNSKVSSTGCFLWLRGVDSDGYGKLHWRKSFHSVRVHRLAAYLFRGISFESNILILHKCRSKNCWNPEHTYEGTKRDNTLDAIRDGTYINNLKNHNHLKKCPACKEPWNETVCNNCGRVS